MLFLAKVVKTLGNMLTFVWFQMKVSEETGSQTKFRKHYNI